MVDRHALNNQLTANIKNVKRAKISVINKLVKKSRKLKEILDKKPNDKFKKKYDKTLEEIKYLKKLKCLDVLKKAILIEKNPKSVITNGNAEAEEIAEMLVISSKILTDIIQKIKAQFSLDELDPALKSTLFNKEKKKNKAKNQKFKEKREEIKKEPKEKSNLNENLENPFKTTKADEESFDNESSCDTKMKEPSSKKKKNISTSSNNEAILQKKTEDVIKSKKQKVNQRKKGKEDEYHNSLDDKFVSQPDPFFTTSSGENYVSTVYVGDQNNPDEDDEYNDNEEDNYKYNKSNNKYGRNINVLSKNTQQKEQKNFKFQNQEETYSQNNKSNSNLHPSWQAKQNLKPVIHNFQGKKITFDNEETNSNNFGKESSHNVETDFNLTKKTNLHPSWEAKQKLKPIIQQFKGKKITFGNENNFEIKKEETNISDSKQTNDLHPSWLAKQKVKPVIRSFEGKKIKFDED